jgi:hypothetical protein
MTIKLKEYKAKPESQKAYVEVDKAKNLILHSIKIYANSKRDDTVTVDKKLQAKVNALKQGDVKSLRALLYSLTRVGMLNIDSKAEKLNLCKHARARQHCFNNVAKALDRHDLIVEYAKPKGEAVKDVKAQSVKATPKKVKAKK